MNAFNLTERLWDQPFVPEWPTQPHWLTNASWWMGSIPQQCVTRPLTCTRKRCQVPTSIVTAKIINQTQTSLLLVPFYTESCSFFFIFISHLLLIFSIVASILCFIHKSILYVLEAFWPSPWMLGLGESTYKVDEQSFKKGTIAGGLSPDFHWTFPVRWSGRSRAEEFVCFLGLQLWCNSVTKLLTFFALSTSQWKLEASCGCKVVADGIA